MIHIETILITGGAGFIGSHMCERLLSEGFRVVALDNFDSYYARAVKERNLTRARQSASFEFVEGDIRDADQLTALFEKWNFSRVLHLAALAGVRRSLSWPSLYADVNLRGLTTLLECVRKSNTRGVVFASSSSVYGNCSRVPWSEDEPANEPVSPYAATKRAGELVAFTYCHLYDLAITCLRFFTVYGPRQRPDMAIHQFARKISMRETITLFGDGSTERDYTYIDDIVNGVTAACHRSPELGFQIINLGNTHRVSLKNLVAEIERQVGIPAQIEWKPDQPGDVERTCADIAKAQRLLDYEPKTNIEEGIRRFVQWMRTESMSQ